MSFIYFEDKRQLYNSLSGTVTKLRSAESRLLEIHKINLTKHFKNISYYQ